MNTYEKTIENIFAKGDAILKKGGRVKYRPHRGLLDDAMAEMKTFDTVDEMFEYIGSEFGKDKDDLDILINSYKKAKQKEYIKFYENNYDSNRGRGRGGFRGRGEFRGRGRGFRGRGGY